MLLELPGEPVVVHGTLLGAPHTDHPYHVGGGKLIATVADADGNPSG